MGYKTSSESFKLGRWGFFGGEGGGRGVGETISGVYNSRNRGKPGKALQKYGLTHPQPIKSKSDLPRYTRLQSLHAEFNMLTMHLIIRRARTAQGL